MNDWTIDDVAARFAEAAETGRRLPRVRVQGYFNVWPEFVREGWEGFSEPEDGYRPLPPSPQAIDRMMEAMHWVQWLEVDQRHLVWMRAREYEWKDICRRFGCSPHIVNKAIKSVRPTHDDRPAQVPRPRPRRCPHPRRSLFHSPALSRLCARPWVCPRVRSLRIKRSK